MTRDIEVDELTGGLKIITDGRVVSSPVPRGFSPEEFRHIVAAVDMLYRRNGILPTEVEVLASWGKFKKKAVQTAFLSDELKKALSLRGIQWDSKDGLTQQQLNAMLLLQNPSDMRTTENKLSSIGVSMTVYRAWMRNPLFRAQMDQQAELNLGDSVPMALNKLIANAEAGDGRAIEKLLEITGRWNPQQQEVQNARQVLTIFIEALEKYASSEVLHSVMGEVQQKTRLLSITSSVSAPQALQEK